MKGWKRVEVLLDRALKTCEALIVICLTLALLGFISYQIAWIVKGPHQERIKSTVAMLNENWKVGLLLLVPLFYRTVRMFLERVRKFLGMETRDPDEISTEPNPEPTVQPPASAEEEED